MMRSVYLYILALLVPIAARALPQQPLEKHLQTAIRATSIVMIHDVVNPPAASRFYAYSLRGAYALVAAHNESIISPDRLGTHLEPLQIPKVGDYNYQVAALFCILKTAEILLPSGYMLEEDQAQLKSLLMKEGLKESDLQKALEVADQVAKQVVAQAASDNYSKLSAMRRYRPLKGDAYWYPTPPGYMEGVEPNWNIITPIFLDSCSQFVPAEPVPYSSREDSPFYKMTMEVYEAVNGLTEEQKLIASFWDCNPFAINTSGHMMIGFKKISPGGHWMGITGIAVSKANLNLDEGILAHTLVSFALMDAFISCWDEKYRSNRVRPETVINRLIDKRWQPLLQTPPFPEYTSGHSVISTAAAEVLSFLLGDSFHFTDDTEVMFDLPVRTFTSFRSAANEAAISRLYGGIHYRDAIEIGQQQGRMVGQYIVNRLKRAGLRPFDVSTP
ncbi:PAP2 superfamily protein [Dyadobacter jejuensis]|uniref:PAP2 superfamily protein n=1 Tax=Dyadobacter jejuensis TaxID=1082580 RepID=A0A316AHF6_9BACT|nr:vanadium-dependent haloperoxidase [Dyadobacter jejuensis]PWJ57133.1 PAP2 superfamily protein [Dyadobacter jejuensis]